MLLDAISIIIIILFFIRGYMKGFIVAVFSVVALLLGIICALKFSCIFATWLSDKGVISSGWAQLISYIVLFIVVVMLVRLIARMIQKVIEGIMLGIINKLAGGILYAFFGAILWSSLLWLGNQLHIISAQTIAASRTYPWLSALAPWFFGEVGKLLPFARTTFTDLQHFFDTINQKLPQHVGTH